MWGKLSRRQREVLLAAASGHLVVDAGSGPPPVKHTPSGPVDIRGLPRVLYLDHKPYPGVVEVDLENVPETTRVLSPILTRDPSAVLLISWPINRGDYRFPFVHLFRTVVYLGMNRMGTACGNPRLFRHFLTRPLLSEVQDTHNDLAVYGEASPGVFRVPTTREEREVFSP